MPVEIYPRVVTSLTASATAVAAGAGVTAGVGARIIAVLPYFAEKRTTSNEESLVYAMTFQTREITERGAESTLKERAGPYKLSTHT